MNSSEAMGMFSGALDPEKTTKWPQVLQPITPETPRGTLLLVWGPEGFSVASYDSAHAKWFAEADGELVNSYEELVCPHPTHWMPLPAAPVNK